MTTIVATKKSQTLQGKLEAFFDAIEGIEKLDDGSVIIEWKSNVAHHVNGHHVVYSQGLQINQAKEIHLNPYFEKKLNQLRFEELGDQVRKAIGVDMNDAPFIIKDNNELLYFHNIEDIPQEFDHLIKFAPTIPSEPHTEEQHAEIETLNDKLQELLKRERK